MRTATATPGFSARRLFRPDSVVLVGDAALPESGIVARNLAAGAFAGRRFCVGLDAPGLERVGDLGALPVAPDLAVLSLPPARVGDTLTTLAARGGFAAIVTGEAPGLTALADGAGVRALGQGSFGLCVPGIGLDASLAHRAPGVGRLGLVAQSSAVTRAVLDWAAAKGVGFSHVVGVGGNANLGFATALDWLSRDPGTSAILLDVRMVHDRRGFLSAARAAARTRPVVAIASGLAAADAAVTEAALRRAGVLLAAGLEDLLAAAETFSRLPGRARPGALRGDRVAVVSNGHGPAQLAMAALRRGGLVAAALSPEARQALAVLVPHRPPANPLVLDPGAGVRLGEAAAALAGLPEVDAVVALHAPTADPADAAAAPAMAAAAVAGPTRAAPIFVGWLGEATAAPERTVIAAAGLAVFATPEGAVRGARHLALLRRGRAAAAELPSREVLTLAPDRGAVAAVFAGVRGAGRDVLDPLEVLAVLAAYGLPVMPGALGSAAAAKLDPPPNCAVLRLVLADDAMWGPWIGLGPGGTAAGLGRLAIGLPPLNLPLAATLIEGSDAARLLVGVGGCDPADPAAVADALVRLSQLAVDWPEVATLTVDALFAAAGGVQTAGASLRLRRAGEGAWLAFPPYPAELVGTFTLRDGEVLTVRPIRPEDATAHLEAFNRLRPQDVRFRFFAPLRALSPEFAARLTNIDYTREMAFIATRHGAGAANRTVGVARLVREPGGSTGEFAIIVGEEMKREGLGRALMERLLAWARGAGVTLVEGQVLTENRSMLTFCRALGFTLRPSREEDGVTEATLALG